MPVNLSIKNAPDDVVDLVRERAQKNHRSLRGELLAIIEDAVRRPQPDPPTPHDLFERAKALGLKTSSSVETIRRMRDDRYGGY
ncbi:MAG TPA: Arc family DNA-binding protein [Stellaceae bacterium]|nr:Arc family DNA-binding protein [Stellaceae bacterium]